MSITPEQLKGWQALCDVATEGPWRTNDKGIVSQVWYFDDTGTARVIGSPGMHDAAFIATARTAMPALIAEVQRMQVKHHADCAWWLCDGAGTADDMHGPHCTHPRQACDRDCASSVPGKEQA